MGVHGLWKLIDSAGKPIPIESLENKILAVDVSIWLYQLVKGFEASGRSLQNAFLLGLFHRICKLLFYRIKPIFVFDGGVPSLKRKTIAARQKNRRAAEESSEKLRQQLLENLVKQQAVGNLLGGDVVLPKTISKTKEDMYILPPLPESMKHIIEEESSSSDEEVATKFANLHDIDVTSEEFLALPPDIRHDILTELKETRKQNSWAKIHLMPEESMDFSSYQMERLLKRRAVQVGLEQAEDELGSRGYTLNDLKKILTDQGVDVGQRIAADSTTRFIYASSADASIQESLKQLRQELKELNESPEKKNGKTEEEIESELNSQKEMLEDYVNKINCKRKEDEAQNDIEVSDQESSSDKQPLSDVDMEQEGLTQNEILQLISLQSKSKSSNVSVFDEMGPSTSKRCITEIYRDDEVLKSTKIDAQSGVNDQTLEHGKNQIENNKKLKLDHEKLPQTDSYCQDTTMMQRDSPLSYNQLKENSSKQNILHIPPETNVQNHSQVSLDKKLIEEKSSPDEISPIKKESDDFTCTNSNEKSSQGDIDKIDVKSEPESTIKNESEEEIFESPESSRAGSSSEDDDDFLDVPMENSSVENVQTPNKNVQTAISKIPGLEITIKTDSADNDDDMFADIFTTKPEENKKKSSLEQSFRDFKNKNRMTVLKSSYPNFDADFEESEENVDDPAIESKPSPDKSTVLKINPKDIVVPNLKSNENAAQLISELEKEMEQMISQKETIRASPAKQTSQSIEEKEAKTIPVVKNVNLTLDDKATKPISTENEVDHIHSGTEADKIEEENYMALKLTTKDITEMKYDLAEESEAIIEENRREERLAASITEQITMDAQHLLQLFGIPYIIAPMEAEAQCAYLDFSGQTNGTITDDSDIWLFGANTVYKNFFDQKKYVKQFKVSDIQQCYRLKRDDLIMIAMLVGSDYTVGINGVGPVNAIEIVAHYPPQEGASTPDERLRVFRDAYHGSRLNAHLSKNLKSVTFCDGFPSNEIVKAYCLPVIDDSKEKFSWSDPDLDKIREFTNEKFGWDKSKTDLTLNPVMDKVKQKTTQKTMHNYFGWAFDKEDPKLSKRVSKAVDILTTGVVPSSPTKVWKRPPNTTRNNRANQNIEKKPSTSAVKIDEDTVIKSKTPAQLARERSARKFKEIKKREQLKKPQNKSKKANEN